MPQGLVQPNNAILYAGEPVYREYEIGTSTNAYPGRLVITETNEWTVTTAGDNALDVMGVLDVEPNELRETVYDTADNARIITGDVVVLLLAASGASIAIGGKVQATTAGKVDQHATAYADVGYALQAKTGDDDEWILVKLTKV